ncbi:MAG TPA: hypothetical protein VN922_16130 [Bacteroidia bacterium]|nr:hypothetical protein [Bacteroidia bacterium]
MKTFEIWAQFKVSERDCEIVRDFFINEIGVKRKFTIRNLHLTVYHARRPLNGVVSSETPIDIKINTNNTRFMVLTPGGENQNINHLPTEHKVGVRIKRNCNTFQDILHYRSGFFPHETQRVLGQRKPSDHRKNAFGTRSFQPHIALLRSGSGIDFDLSKTGTLFRNKIKQLTFDKYLIEIKVKNTNITDSR